MRNKKILALLAVVTSSLLLSACNLSLDAIGNKSKDKAVDALIKEMGIDPDLFDSDMGKIYKEEIADYIGYKDEETIKEALSSVATFLSEYEEGTLY